MDFPDDDFLDNLDVDLIASQQQQGATDTNDRRQSMVCSLLDPTSLCQYVITYPQYAQSIILGMGGYPLTLWNCHILLSEIFWHARG